MFATLEDEPDAQKIIGDNTTTGRENITQRKVDAMKIIFLRENSRQINTENFKWTNFYYGA